MHWRRKWQPTPVFLPGESQDGGAWWAAVYGVAQSWTRLKRLSSSSSHFYNSVALSRIIFFCNHHHLTCRTLPSQTKTYFLTYLVFFVCACSVMSNSLWPPWTIACQGSSAHGIFQARILEWVAICYSIHYFYSRINVQASRVVGGPKLICKVLCTGGAFFRGKVSRTFCRFLNKFVLFCMSQHPFRKTETNLSI